MSVIVLKPLRQSELGWFAACRDAGRETSRQRGLNLDASFVHRILRPETSSVIELQTRWHDGTTICQDSRTIRLQRKNWRLTGPKIVGERFASIQPGDPLLLLFESRSDGGWQLTWDVVDCSPAAAELREYCLRLLDRQSARILSPREAGGVLDVATRLLPVFHKAPDPNSPAGQTSTAPQQSTASKTAPPPASPREKFGSEPRTLKHKGSCGANPPSPAEHRCVRRRA